MENRDRLICAVRSGVCKTEIPSADFIAMSAEEQRDLYRIAKKSDVSHIVGSVLCAKGLITDREASASFSKDHMLAVFRYRRLTDELGRLRSCFEESSIPHIALKGSVLREYYPDPWMRTSCDIDILIHKNDLERASSLLTEKLGYTKTDSTPCDVSFESQSGVHLELHFSLISDDKTEMGDEILDKVWEYTYLQEGKRYTLFMKDEMFYYYHIVHMAKHFQSGGCGIKAILDLWILDNKLPGNSQKRADLISKSKYADFERGAKLLSAVWFDQEPADNFTRLLENYIFKGGAYGTVENGVNVGVAKKGGRIKYVLSRIFPSFRTMRLNYPILEKHKILLPFLHVRRWFRIVFLSGMKKAKSQISHSTKISDAKADEITEMLTKLGLIK